MPRITFRVESAMPPAQVIAMLTDFSSRRPQVWPSLDPGLFRVLAVDTTGADVIEGGGPIGNMWAQERYDWSGPGIVRAEIVQSSLFRPGGQLVYEVSPAPVGSAEGSHIEVTWDRRPASIRGALITLLVVLVGRSALAEQLREALDAWQSDARRQPPTTTTLRGNPVSSSTEPASASTATRSSIRTPISPSR